jgi:pimeloyl-ACP methyl ester carboxylesterase
VPISPTALLALVLLTPEPPIETRLVQVAPPAPFWAAPRPTPRTPRAVVLIHGLRPHPLSETNVWEPELSSWEEPSSPLVKTLTADADVFSLAYGQNASVDDIGRVRSLGQHITGLRAAGYSEVVLVGYSAGALIARYYVENTGGGGVTKVIQVCPPNGGSGWSKLAGGVRKSQEVFVKSLSKEACGPGPSCRFPPTSNSSVSSAPSAGRATDWCATTANGPLSCSGKASRPCCCRSPI